MRPGASRAEASPRCVIATRLQMKTTLILVGKTRDKLYTHAIDDYRDRIGRVSTVENLSDEAAARRIDQVNQGRSNHYHQYTGAHWTDARDYDLVVNTSSVGLEQAANIILQCVKDKMKN